MKTTLKENKKNILSSELLLHNIQLKAIRKAQDIMKGSRQKTSKTLSKYLKNVSEKEERETKKEITGKTIAITSLSLIHI